MAKLLAIFNVLAAAASIAGLFFSLQLESRNELMAVAFLAAAALCFYVLFAPANPIEMNVAAKLQHFRRENDGQRSAVQRGEFSIYEGGPTSVQFHQPFAEPPVVKVTHLRGKSGRLPYVAEVSTLHAEFAQGTYSSDTRTFGWVAHGKALEPVATLEHAKSENDA